MRIRDGKSSDLGWQTFGSGILDKHPGSTTLFVGHLACLIPDPDPLLVQISFSLHLVLFCRRFEKPLEELLDQLRNPPDWSRPIESWASLNLIQQQLNNR